MTSNKNKQTSPGLLQGLWRKTRAKTRENFSQHPLWELWVDVITVTLLTLLFTWLLFDSDFSGNLFGTAAEIDTPELIDLYSASAHQTDVPRYSNITLLSIDGCSRQEVTTALEILNGMEPRAIGVDVVFQYPAEEDDALINAIVHNDKIVMATIPYNGSYFEHALREQGTSFGSVVFNTSSRYDVVRSFLPAVLNETDTTWSFDILLARKAGATTGCFVPYDKQQYIAYSNLMMDTLNCLELIDPSADLTAIAERVKDKIILMGDLNALTDLHRTPIDANMSGVMIHAYMLDTILRHDIISVSPDWLNWLIALIVCFVSSVAMLYFKWAYDDAEGLALRVTQLVLMILVVVLPGVACFWLCRWYFDFTPTFFALAIQAVVLDIWVGIMAIVLHLIRSLHSKKSKK